MIVGDMIIIEGLPPPDWNGGMLEYWKNGSWPPAPLPAHRACRPVGRAYGSERILQYWVNGKIRLNDIVVRATVPA